MYVLHCYYYLKNVLSDTSIAGKNSNQDIYHVVFIAQFLIVREFHYYFEGSEENVDYSRYSYPVAFSSNRLLLI